MSDITSNMAVLVKDAVALIATSQLNIRGSDAGKVEHLLQQLNAFVVGAAEGKFRVVAVEEEADDADPNEG